MSQDDTPPFERAAEEGWSVIVADDNHLQLDLDIPATATEKWRAYDDKHEEIYEILDREAIITGWIGDTLDVVSKSGHVHRYIKLEKPLNHDVRIALQALLGSDAKRETLSLSRKYGVSLREPATVMFELPHVADLVKRWLAKPLARTQPGTHPTETLDRGITGIPDDGPF